MRNLFVAVFATAGIAAGAATLIADQGIPQTEDVSVTHVDSSFRRGTRPAFVTPDVGSAKNRTTDWNRRGSRVDYKPADVTRNWNTGSAFGRRGTRSG